MKKNHCVKPSWPVLRCYEGEHLFRVAMPLGGIGTGTVSLGGRGQLRDWELGNRPAKGFQPDHTFFVLYAQPTGGQAVIRALEGAILPVEFEGASGCPTPNHGLPRFRRCVFETAYPLAAVRLSDPEVPLEVRLEAFNPMVPADVEASGIPLAVLRYVLRNRTSKRVVAAVCGNLQNFIGAPDRPKEWGPNTTTVRVGANGWRGLFFSSTSVPADHPRWGTLALTTDVQEISTRTAWRGGGWGFPLLDFWDDLSADGRLEEVQRSAGDLMPMGSLAAQVIVPPNGERAVTFLLSWHFPNRQGWHSSETDSKETKQAIVGNYYATRYSDAWDVIEKTAPHLVELERRTVRFVEAFCASDGPDAIKEAALFNLSTLRSQTCFRIESGHLMAWEGCHDKSGCCFGSCTHVWNYEPATAFLYGELARSMREVEFRYALQENGLMAFRAELPLGRAATFGKAAADGQLGCIVKMYREWQLAGDDAWLRDLWPGVRRALEFCWVPGGWDADQDGVMEGCQHNTMDVEYYGPNPQMQFWYLAALRAAEEMARYLGEGDFAARCRRLFEQGSSWVDTHLFNGEYYEHEIRPPADPSAIAAGLQVGMGAKDPSQPTAQLGSGCLADQLVGQHLAHLCDLGYLADRRKIRKTLQSIWKYNRRSPLYGHFNHLRSFALSDETALLMASYPRGRRPKEPFPYFNEVMTGFEYTAAAHMIYEGQEKNGLKAIADIRSRYDGKRRNPFNEAECGHHYGRAMASWGAFLAWTGFHYSAVTRTLRFIPREGRHFWSTGYAWGVYELTSAGTGRWKVNVTVQEGRLNVRRLILDGAGEVLLPSEREMESGQCLSVSLSKKRSERAAHDHVSGG